ncbi:hypothetical protein GE09DRAFT_396616 [Coniochaeta sp. 2T2.1]|nr:hypothetical protein GE09DRAFT_396616 [Coniochaeta sp. 2T2.1]
MPPKQTLHGLLANAENSTNNPFEVLGDDEPKKPPRRRKGHRAAKKPHDVPPPPNPPPKLYPELGIAAKYLAYLVKIDDTDMQKYSCGECRAASHQGSVHWYSTEGNTLRKVRPAHAPVVVLLGDEKFASLGRLGLWESLEPFPSEDLFPDPLAADMIEFVGCSAPFRRKGVVNLGVSGDNIMNVIYRLQGTSPEQMLEVQHADWYSPMKSLWEALRTTSGGVELWVIHVGLNDIRQNVTWDPRPLYVMLQLIFDNTDEKSQILLTGLFLSEKYPDDLVRNINVQYRAAAVYFGEKYGKERIQYLPLDIDFEAGRDTVQDKSTKEEMLTANAYQEWAERLVLEMWNMIGPQPPQNP